MAKHTIEIVITETGEIESTVHGLQGPACSRASAWLDDQGQVIKDEKTKEYYQRLQAKAQNQAGR